MPISLGQIADLGMIAALAGILIHGRIGTARAFALFAIAVILTGRISFEHALETLGSPSIWAVISLIIFSMALTKLTVLRRLFFSSKPQGLRATLTRMLSAAAALSAVVPNTAVVAALLGPASRRKTVSAHQLLLPLSYMALTAGMMTPFGTSASLMVVGQASAIGVHLSFLDFLLPGALVTLGVLITVVLAAPLLLKEKANARQTHQEIFFVEASVDRDSRLVGKSIAENKLRQLHSFFLAEIIRGDRTISPVHPLERLQADDRLIFVGDIQHMDELQNLSGLHLISPDDGYKHGTVYRGVVSASSMLVGRTLREADFRARFDASVMGIQRAAAPLSGKLGEVRLRAGDLLLLAAGPDFHIRDNVRSNLHLVDADDGGLSRLGTRDTILMGLAFAGFLFAALFQLTSIALAAALLAAIAVLLDWVSPREVRRNFPFDLVIVLWGAVLLSKLVAQSGLSGWIAGGVSNLAADLPLAISIAAIFFMAWLLTEFFSNTSAALIALPVALDTASSINAAPEVFALAAAFGASASFFMPFGYQTHLMVMGPGKYHLSDYFRLGGVVFVVYSTLAITGLNLFAR